MRYTVNMPQPKPDPLHLEGSPIHEDEEGNIVLRNDDMHNHKSYHKFKDKNHNKNLAREGGIPKNILANIIMDLDMAIQSDLNSRMPWSKIQETGLQYMGLEVERRETPWTGACGVYSSTMMQAIITTANNIIGECMPLTGPAKPGVEGKSTEEKNDSAEAWAAFYNHFFTVLRPGFRADFEEAVQMHLIPMGSVPFKIYRLPGERWPDVRYSKPDDFIVNTDATSLHMAERITHILKLTPRELINRQISGMYSDIDLVPDDSDDPTKSNYAQRADRIKGIVSVDREYNPNYTLFEVQVMIDLGKYWDEAEDDTDLPKPYRITYDKNSKQCLGFYSNWKKDDKSYDRENCWVNSICMPGFGICGVGYNHLLSGNAMAATALERQMVDLGSARSFPGGLRKKGVKYLNSEILVSPGTFIEVDTGAWELDQCFMPMPFPDPSPVLKELKDDIEKSMLDLAGAATAAIGETPANTPSTTILAVLDKQEAVQSAIVKRMHCSLGEIFRILFDMFKESFAENPYEFKHQGKVFRLGKNNMDDDFSVVPVSDPNLSSFPKRAMTADSLLDICDRFPDYFDKLAILKIWCKTMNIDNADEILKDPDEQAEIQPTDPITENGNLMQGNPVKAFMEQDHKSHIIIHSIIPQDQSLVNSNDSQSVIQAAQAHIKEHQAMDMMITMFAQIGMPVPEDPSEIPPETQNQIAMMSAQIIMQQQQQAAQNTPPTPEMVMLEEIKVKDKQVMLEAEAKRADHMIQTKKLELEAIRLEQDNARDERKLDLEEQKIVISSEGDHLRAETEAYKAHINHNSKLDSLKKKQENDVPSIGEEIIE